MFSPFSAIRRKVQIIVNNKLNEAEKDYLDRFDSIDEKIDQRYELAETAFNDGVKALVEGRKKELINIELERADSVEALQNEAIESIVGNIIH